jgi:hypothetical protein
MAPMGDPAYTVDGLEVVAGERYLAIATGYLGSTDAADSFRVLAAVDAFDPTVMNAQVGFVHASPNTPAVDVGVDTRGMIGDPLFANVGFGGTASTIEVPAGTYTLGAAATGGTNSLITFDVPLASSTRAWALATGEFPDLTLHVVDTSQTPWALIAIAPNGDAR